MSDRLSRHDVFSNTVRGLLQQLPAGVQHRFDGWQNALSGLGSWADKTTRTSPTYFCALNDTALAAMFHGDHLCRRAVDKRPRSAMSKGMRVSVPDDAGGIKASTAMQDAFDELRVVERFTEAAIWEALFGGAVIWVGVDDARRGADSQEWPINEKELGQVLWLKVIDRRFVQPGRSLELDANSPHFGQPTHYDVQAALGSSTTVTARIHRSRLIIFPGALATAEQREARNGWGLSVLDPVYDVVQRHVTAWQSAGNAMANASYVVHKLKGLAQMLGTEGGEAKLKARSRAMEMAKSLINAVLIDADDEYIREKADFGGMPAMLEAFMHEVASALDTPVTVLFGRSPAGMNATGESDLQMWRASVATYQAQHLRPRLEELGRLLMLSKQGPTKGRELSGWRIDFPPLGELTPTQDADRRLKQAQADAAYIEASVLLPSEVALSRFRPEGYSVETTIDIDTRKLLHDAEVEQLEQSIADPKELTADSAAATSVPSTPSVRGLFGDARHDSGTAYVDSRGNEHRNG